LNWFEAAPPSPKPASLAPGLLAGWLAGFGLPWTRHDSKTATNQVIAAVMMMMMMLVLVVPPSNKRQMLHRARRKA
jgi:hypothetical protein